MKTNQAISATGIRKKTPTMLPVSVNTIASVEMTTPSAIGTARKRRCRRRISAYSSSGMLWVS